MTGYLGIDTSCYTTSIALLDETGKLVADLRKPLDVKPGGRGLAQSEMVFQHIRNLPVLFEKLQNVLGARTPILRGIGVSASPRSSPDSYMPVFVAGESFARTVSCLSGAPLFRLSHQAGHVFAGIRSAGWPSNAKFLAVHISGGTTEVVRASVSDTLEVDILGGTKDLHGGQFIDRIGVALGLPFPAGSHLEILASKAETAEVVPVAAKGVELSFSGPETHVLRLIAAGAGRASIAAGVQLCVARSVLAMICSAVEMTNLTEVMIVGGVSCNNFIRTFLKDNLEEKGIQLMFPDNMYSSDNATGAAYFAFWRSTYSVTLA